MQVAVLHRVRLSIHHKMQEEVSRQVCGDVKQHHQQQQNKDEEHCS
jgi:hypothetical protein